MDQFLSFLSEAKYIEQNRTEAARKEGGVFYTPFPIVEYIVGKTLGALDGEKRIVDLSCGAGMFLYAVLRQIQETTEIPLQHAVEQMVWGIDIDPNAVCVCRSLLKSAGGTQKTHILQGDALLMEVEERFDYVIGNPPYIGHKSVSSEYKQVLREKFPGIYRDKADISFCFLKRAVDLAKDGGYISFITSSYFMEGPSGKELRAFLAAHCRIVSIVDFSGKQIFDEARIATCIITLQKGRPQTVAEVRKRKIQPVRRKNPMHPDNFDRFEIGAECFRPEGWLLLDQDRLGLFRSVEGAGRTVGDYFHSHQGIITGCDKGFIVGPEEIDAWKLEPELLHRWIKNSDVWADEVRMRAQYIIYADAIEDPNSYPHAISYIAQQERRLQGRRECRRGYRKWYELQWGRQLEIFLREKIVYPYKAAENRFAVDRSGCLCSADVYALTLKEEFLGKIPLEYFTLILNSRFYTEYFQCYAKKLCNGLYDYYPNTVLRMRLPEDIDPALLSLAKQLRTVDVEEMTVLRESAEQRLRELFQKTGR